MSRTLFIQLERLGDLIQTTRSFGNTALRTPKQRFICCSDENQSALEALAPSIGFIRSRKNGLAN
ncbi:MAG: hypothetical protein CM15mP74_27230 [Halieaceae bacterium]|nr:MAG: hypothetical protein CM15mP74_27230 [Halieaceae bacterium]